MMAWECLQENRHGVTTSYIKSFPGVARLLGLEPLDFQAAWKVSKLAKERRAQRKPGCKSYAGESVPGVK